MTMNDTGTIDASTIEPLQHGEAMALLAVELDRTLGLLRSFDDDDWTKQTDCPAWDVRAMYLHVLGACEAGASMRENMHQLRAGKRYQKRNGGPLEAALSAVQVDERAELEPAQLVERFADITPRTVRGRTRTPAAMRRVKMKVDGPVFEKWSLGYLIDTIYLRDLWMHRVDACRATGRSMELTTEHDGRIVNDVVAEWARRHGQPFQVVLTGPAGGTFMTSDDSTQEPAAIEMDAVDFCRTLAGRAEGTGLLTTIVPF
jgi:uncharacterized protein (TIGR03083 family)